MTNSTGPDPNPGQHQNHVTLADDRIILADPKWRVSIEGRRLRNARLAEQAMPLARYYQHHGGPLLAVPIGVFYVSGRWAA